MPRPAGQKGSIYLPVLSAAMLVSIIGLSAVLLTRTQRRAGQGQLDYVEAQMYARSAIETGLLFISANQNWRTQVGAGQWTTDLPIGSGTCSVTATDPDDGDLGDSPYDSVEITGTGVKGSATHKMQVGLYATEDPLEFLRTCLHANGEIDIQSGKILTLEGGPISTNGNLLLDGTLDGDAEAATLSGGGTITGTLTVPAQSKPMPANDVFQKYVDMAVTISLPGITIQKAVLGPGINPWGLSSPEGVYYINTGGKDLQIQGMRIWGTLVIDAGGKKVRITDSAFLEPYNSQYPVLIVNGDLDLELRSSEYGLRESTWLTNFNPSGMPYLGQSDPDVNDVYPNEVRGLVHVLGDLRLWQTNLVRGVIICEGAVLCDGFTGIIRDTSLYENPPMWYATTRMKLTPGSWKRVVD